MQEIGKGWSLDLCATLLASPSDVMGVTEPGRYAVHVGLAKTYFPPHCWRNCCKTPQEKRISQRSDGSLIEGTGGECTRCTRCGRPELWSCRDNMAAKPVWLWLNCTYCCCSPLIIWHQLRVMWWSCNQFHKSGNATARLRQIDTWDRIWYSRIQQWQWHS